MGRKQLYFTLEDRKEAIRRNSLKTRLKHADRCLARALNYQAKDQAGRLLRAAKQRAKRDGLEFSLTRSDIIIPKYCPYLGCMITNIYRQGRIQTNASLDRIDSTKGYISGNVQIISDLANRMKQEANSEQLVAFAKGILKMYA